MLLLARSARSRAEGARRRKVAGPLFAESVRTRAEIDESEMSDAVMPMIELSLTEGALTEKQTSELLHRATKTLMWWEKVADTPQGRSIAWTLATELPADKFLVGGLTPVKPRYRFRVHTIEGLLDDRAKQGIIRDLTKLTLQIEGASPEPDNLARVWVLLREYPRANWGIAGVPFAPSGYLSALEEISIEHDRPLD